VARGFAKEYGVIGFEVPDLVAGPGDVFINPTGNPGWLQGNGMFSRDDRGFRPKAFPPWKPPNWAFTHGLAGDYAAF
jgi:hypothetical protein